MKAQITINNPKSITYASVMYALKAMTALATLTGPILAYIMMGLFDAFGNAVAIKYIFTDGIKLMIEPKSGEVEYWIHLTAEILSLLFSIFVSGAMSLVIMVLHLQKPSDAEAKLMERDEDYRPKAQRRAKELSIVTGILSMFAFMMMISARYPTLDANDFFFGQGAFFRWFLVGLCASLAYYTPRAYDALANEIRDKHGKKIYTTSDEYDELVGDVLLAKAKAIAKRDTPAQAKNKPIGGSGLGSFNNQFGRTGTDD